MLLFIVHTCLKNRVAGDSNQQHRTDSVSFCTCRLMMFFAGWPIIWFIVNIIVWSVVITMERMYYK